ncbi:MAG: hypothetical protein MJH10_18895 [Epibacterium sp.]|nr:hypothetical protein [Epibacterium sp.]NQX75553.1 hypothetical protein [Epibacterium sp.]
MHVSVAITTCAEGEEPLSSSATANVSELLNGNTEGMTILDVVAGVLMAHQYERCAIAEAMVAWAQRSRA